MQPHRYHALMVSPSVDPYWQPDLFVPITENLYFLPLSSPVTRTVTLGQSLEGESRVTAAEWCYLPHL